MKRREFMQVMMPVAGMPVIYPIWKFSKPLRHMSRSQYPLNFPDDGRVLVLVQLGGGNDGLNTVIPYSNDIYYNMRPQLAIPQNEVITLNNDIGLHGSMTPFESMFGNGDLGIVQGVGYPNPDRSHFRSTDIWLTGSGSDEVQETGWLGRYFDMICAEGEMCGTNGPPAIQIGLNASLALLGRDQKGITLNNPQQFFSLVSRLGDGHNPDPFPMPTTPAEHELAFLRDTEAAAFQFAEEIINAYEANENAVQYPNESLANQLSIVGRLIAGGLSTRVYIVSISGFDTHASQAGTHSLLLGNVANAISLFQQELAMFGVADRVVGMCFSEFGRRVNQNASQGTDHGTSAPLFLFGNPVMGGLHGVHPSLSDLQDGDMKHLVDYRQIYATLLEQWLAADSASILGEGFTTLPLINTPTSIETESVAPNEFHLAQNYPNPFNPSTTITYTLPRTTRVKLEVFNNLGQRISTLVNKFQNRGRYEVIWQANGHPSGAYFYKISAGDFQETKRMTLLK